MTKAFLLVSFFVIIFSSNIEGRSYGENLLAKLNKDIHDMNDLMVLIKQHYREETQKNPRLGYPQNYHSTLRRASTTMGDALRLIENIVGKNRRNKDDINEDDVRNVLSNEQDQDATESTRRSNDLMWKTNFYKALSRALKDEFRDDELIQENVHDGFVPPTLMKKRSGKL